MTRIITYGTFDLLHYGHINLLRRAKQLGDYLIVALSTDEFNRIEKNKSTYFDYQRRKQLLEAIRYVDLVIPEYSWEQKEDDIEKYDIDIFLMGDDWKDKFDFLMSKCKVIYLPRTVEISTTKIRQDLKSFGPPPPIQKKTTSVISTAFFFLLPTVYFPIFWRGMYESC
jgi:glycerol-3-phosphate cytidylyltransferase